jgi:hypothetical protein
MRSLCAHVNIFFAFSKIFFKDLSIPRRRHLFGQPGRVFELRDDASEEFRSVEFIDNSSIHC